MTRRRLWYVVVGVCAFVIGLLEITVGVVPLALDRPLVNLVAGAALLFGYRVAKRRWRDRPTETDTPDPELAAGASVPGEDLREALAAVPGIDSGGYLRLAHDALRDVTVGALVRYSPIDGASAAQSVSEGRWTDDPVAAALLREGMVLPTAWTRVRRHLTGESTYERAVRGTVVEIARIAGIEASPAGGKGLLDRLRRTDPDRPRTVHPPDGAHPSPRDDAGDATAAGRSRPTGRWRSVGALALFAVAVGILYGAPGVVLGSAVIVGVAAYGRTGTAPPVDLRIDRTVGNDRPDAGEEVEVTLRVHNESGVALPDLRLIDGVPAALRVESGSPRLATSLGPDGTATVTYTIVARRGTHEFGPTMAICRDLAGTAERTEYVEPSEDDGSVDTAIVCRPRYRGIDGEIPLRRHPAPGSGPVPTAIGGSGVEFHDTREYRPGDPPSRIDWNRLARVGTLGTTEFREERVATVVLVVDARPSAYCSPGTDEHALDRAVDAAGRLGVRLLGDGHRVGFAAFGSDDCWLAPGAGRDQRDLLRELLSTHEALSPFPDPDRDGESPLSRTAAGRSGRQRRAARGGSERMRRRRLERRLPDRAQLLVCTPLVDRGSARLARELEARGYPVTVVSPDPTATGTSGQVVARIGRRFRITDLRRAGLSVVDWPWTDSLDATLERHAELDR